TNLPVTSHICTPPSGPQTEPNSRFPSALKLTPQMPPPLPLSRVAITAPVLRSQTLTVLTLPVPGQLPAARELPSGLKATLHRRRVSPATVRPRSPPPAPNTATLPAVGTASHLPSRS